ncbi:MAG: V-type ATPase subunit [Nanoarchaeales archaeon]|nr:V-type ATPase subunit [Nanoarchaeales archaeon]
MAKVIKLKKDSYNCAKLAVASGKLYGTDKIKELMNLEFDEILRFLEENGFRNSVDKSYLQYNGFYLVERVLNDHLSEIYKSVFAGANKVNQKLLESYYLKYQVHNILVVLRCKLANEEEFETYLIGDSKQKSNYIKAFAMPSKEDALEYLVKKLGFNSETALEHFKSGLYNLENYLYKTYYTKLNELNFKFNNIDEKNFSNFIRNYIDLLNARTYLRLKVEDSKSLNFKDFYMFGGRLVLEDFTSLNSKNLDETLKSFNETFGQIEGIDSDSFESLDQRISHHKKDSESLFNGVRFGSPFFALKFLFKVEKEMNQLRVLLKAKYLKLDKAEIERLI